MSLMDAPVRLILACFLTLRYVVSDDADPDMLEVGNGGMTNDEYIVHFSIWAISKVSSANE